MERIWYFKLSLVIAILLGSGICVWGALPEPYRIPFLQQTVNTQLQLGLDLQGGIRLVYEVLIEDAVRQRRRQTAEGLRNAVVEDLRVKNVAYREVGDTRFLLLFESQADATKVTHAFVRRNGWADDRGRADAAEAHFLVPESSQRPSREVARATKRQVSERLSIPEIGLEMLPDRRFALILPNAAALDRLQGEVVEALDGAELVGRYRRSIDFHLEAEAHEQIVDTAVNQAMEVIGNRIDELGVANTTVSQSGTNVIVEIPARQTGQTENEAQSEFVARTKRLIERTARLEFRIADDQETRIYQRLRPLVAEDPRVELVPDDRSYFLRAADTKTAGGVIVPGNKVLGEFLARAAEQGVEIPDNRDFRFEEIASGGRRGKKAAGPVEKLWRSYYLNREAQVTGEHIADARIAYEQQGPEAGMPYVSLSFNERGRKAFGQVTKASVGKRMAIVLDDRINSAPVIQEAILGGEARITLGSYGDRNALVEEARDLVVVLRAGGLPAPISLVNEETIGPQLGHDSIRRGQISILVGAVFVVIFMFIYYRGAGVIANLALISNLMMIFAILGLLGATLTLPGLAGIVLTVGMAVDANVIIFERIREELRAGKSPRAAVDAGYGRAFWTIFDAQFTTLIAGVVLLDQGTGPIRGFAVTLLIGIVTSMVSAIFISRVAFDWVTRRKRLERLSI